MPSSVNVRDHVVLSLIALNDIAPDNYLGFQHKL